jgi:regulator of nucleoside diphosphate kinase
MKTTRSSTLAKRPAAPVITDVDHRRLRGLIDLLRERADDPALEALESELDMASVVASQDLPANVVTMNSTVEVVDLDSQDVRSLTLVFPGASAVGGGSVSVLAPVGVALLGARAGQVVTWPAPGGVRRARVDRVAHPDAAGDHHL